MQYSSNQDHKNKEYFSTNQIQNISELGEVLKRIRARLKSEGVSIDVERKKLLAELQKS